MKRPMKRPGKRSWLALAVVLIFCEGMHIGHNSSDTVVVEHTVYKHSKPIVVKQLTNPKVIHTVVRPKLPKSCKDIAFWADTQAVEAAKVSKQSGRIDKALDKLPVASYVANVPNVQGLISTLNDARTQLYDDLNANLVAAQTLKGAAAKCSEDIKSAK